MTRLWAVVLLSNIALAACATDSGVLPVGKDTYTITTNAALTGSIGGNNILAKRKALTAANQFCINDGKQLVVQNIAMNSTPNGSSSDLIFRCLDQNDPENQRPNFRKDPNIVIQNQNN